jgi:SAM-dependent methyltransferase
MVVQIMGEDAFKDVADAYEAMIDWRKRLGNEEPLYRWLFERVGALSVLDVACGTGHHAAMFHSWKMRVEGADVSEAMIERCRARHGESETLGWVVRGFDQAVEEPGQFDVTICVGNSLALAKDRESVAEAMRQMLEAVRTGGAVVVHVVNLWRMADGPCASWQKCARARLPQGDCLIIKGTHRCGDMGYVDLLVTRLESEPPLMHAESVRFLGLRADELVSAAQRGGARAVEVYGGYQRQAYDAEKSADLVVVAMK